MPFTQIDNVLKFNDEVVKARGTLWRPQDLAECTEPRDIADEEFRSFTVRVCHRPDPNAAQTIAEGSVARPSDWPMSSPGRWELDLPIETDHAFVHGTHGCATLVLVYEAGGDLFSLTWAECVQFEREGIS